tara:strand:- start:1846 stop:1947 length:102 start_codon:yes stop_codon:yes gene_type:complete
MHIGIFPDNPLIIKDQGAWVMKIPLYQVMIRIK